MSLWLIECCCTVCCLWCGYATMTQLLMWCGGFASCASCNNMLLPQALVERSMETSITAFPSTATLRTRRFMVSRYNGALDVPKASEPNPTGYSRGLPCCFDERPIGRTHSVLSGEGVVLRHQPFPPYTVTCVGLMMQIVACLLGDYHCHGMGNS